MKSEKASVVRTETHRQKSDVYSRQYADKKASSEVDNTPKTVTEITNSSYTVTYKYDKKGHAKKVTDKSNGISREERKVVYGLTNLVNTDKDGSKYTVVGQGADCEEIVTTVVAGTSESTTRETKPYRLVVNGVPDAPRKAEKKTEVRTVRYNQATLGDNTTATYKYDKNGNRKSAKISINSRYFVSQVNETFGNGIYQFVNAENIGSDYNPYQKPEIVKVITSNVTKNSISNTNTIKKKSKRLKTVLSIGTSKLNRASASVSGYLSGKVTYSLKGKKFNKKKAKDVELQQWTIQNGRLNGAVGLGI